MTSIALLRTTYLNGYVQRAEADTVPWTDAVCNQALTDALRAQWPDFGLRISGTVATDQSTNVYSVPSGMEKIVRIDIESNGLVIDQVTNFRWRGDANPPTKVVIKPVLASGYTLRFDGWKPWGTDAADLPVDWEPWIAMWAASELYGALASNLANSQRQQGLDSGRVVDYQTAVGLSAYWLRRFVDAVDHDPNRTAGAVRRGRR